jgi:hypothetical protein
MLLSGGIAPVRVTEALAQFALSHPMTYSTEALQVAAELLVCAPVRAPEQDAVADSAGAVCRWWRHFARRMSCH